MKVSSILQVSILLRLKKEKEKILKEVERREDRRKEGGHKSNVLQRVGKYPHVLHLPAVRLPEDGRNIRPQDT